MNRPFIKGLKLSELFYKKAVKPILATHFSDLTYSAGLIGNGSEVLGLDTPQSMDHDWGPRLMLFLTRADHQVYCDELCQVLRQELPHEIHGYPTNLAVTGVEKTLEGEEVASSTDHSVMFLTIERFFRRVLNFDPTGEIRAVDWLGVPDYSLLGLTKGNVFHDGLGQLEPIRAKLCYYPHDVWLYLLAAQWRRIGQEEAFMGRCGQVSDDLGSRLVAARLVRDLAF